MELCDVHFILGEVKRSLLREGDDDDSLTRPRRCKEYLGIGYHYVIRSDGAIEEGRPLELWGAHVWDHNDYTTGICVNGNLEEEDITEAQYETLLLLGRWVQKEFERLETWHPHCELEPTLCPGASFPWERFRKGLRKVTNMLEAFVPRILLALLVEALVEWIKKVYGEKASRSPPFPNIYFYMLECSI